MSLRASTALLLLLFLIAVAIVELSIHLFGGSFTATILLAFAIAFILGAYS